MARNEPKMTSQAPMYVYATEMVGSYYKRLSLKGKRVLTIVGSGDQVLNAHFYGAREVVGVDINRNALFITELKLCAIEMFTYREFLKFFNQRNNGFGRRSYERLRMSLSRPCRTYFDRLFTAVGKRSLGRSVYFRQREVLFGSGKRVNAYLVDADAYEKMRTIIRKNKPVLLNADILHLTRQQRLGKFELINLSNVPNYLTGRSFGLTERQVLGVLKHFKPLLSTRGSVIFYGYNSRMYTLPPAISEPPISKHQFYMLLKTSGTFDVRRIFFPGMNSYGWPDRVTVLQHATKRSKKV